MTGEGEKKHYFLINNFARFMYDHSLHRGKMDFCHYCLHVFITKGILKCHIRDCSKINGNQAIKMPKKYESVKLKSFERKIHYCLHAFITEEILKRHIRDCFKINGNQTIKMPKKDESVKLKNFERKIKTPFKIYADFESILVPEDNGKQNPNESYIIKHQKHVALSYVYKLICVDDNFSKPLKS